MSSPSEEVNTIGQNKHPHVGLRNDDDDKANSLKKVSLKVVDKSHLGMVFSVRPSTKLSKINIKYRSRLELDVSSFKLIFNGLHIMEDETVSLLKM